MLNYWGLAGPNSSGRDFCRFQDLGVYQRERRKKLLRAGIFLGNIYKYQNDHSDNFGGAILAQQEGFLTVPCLLKDISNAGMAP